MGDEEMTAQLAGALVMSRNRQMDAAALLPVVRKIIALGAVDELDEMAGANRNVSGAKLLARAVALREKAGR